MNVRAIIHWLHLWLGLTSGIVVFIVSITGCIYVFQNEISDALEPWRFVDAQDETYAPPSQLLDSAKVYVPQHQPTGITYDGKEGAAAVGFWINEGNYPGFTVVFLNPYDATFIKKQIPLGKQEFNFFQFIVNGHQHLWLPPHMGRPVVGISVLIFLILLITGIILWWPRTWNRHTLKQKFTIKFSGNFNRINLDLHNTLGIYSLLFAMIFAITGLVWSFNWFGNGLYYLTSGGEQKMEHHHPHSGSPDSIACLPGKITALDLAFYKALETEPNPARIYLTPYPEDEDDAIEIVFYQKEGKYYHQNEYFYDQYSVEPLRTKGDRYTEATFADKLEMANYDLHTGSILGLPGKIIAFLVSLFCASLPITGFIYWWKRKQKQKRLLEDF